MNEQAVRPTTQAVMVKTVTKAMTCSLDRKSVVLVTEQTIPKEHLQQQLNMLLRQANQINAQIAKVTELLGLITEAETAATDGAVVAEKQGK